MAVLMLEKYYQTRNESLDKIIFSETDEEVMNLREAIGGDERLLFNEKSTKTREVIWFERASCGCFRA